MSETAGLMMQARAEEEWQHLAATIVEALQAARPYVHEVSEVSALHGEEAQRDLRKIDAALEIFERRTALSKPSRQP